MWHGTITCEHLWRQLEYRWTTVIPGAVWEVQRAAGVVLVLCFESGPVTASWVSLQPFWSEPGTLECRTCSREEYNGQIAELQYEKRSQLQSWHPLFTGRIPSSLFTSACLRIDELLHILITFHTPLLCLLLCIIKFRLIALVLHGLNGQLLLKQKCLYFYGDIFSAPCYISFLISFIVCSFRHDIILSMLALCLQSSQLSLCCFIFAYFRLL